MNKLLNSVHIRENKINRIRSYHFESQYFIVPLVMTPLDYLI